MKTVDITPTWGEIANLLWRLIQSNEQKALQHAHSEFARAFAMAEALSQLHPTLTEEQHKLVQEILETELRKQVSCSGSSS